MPKVSICIPTYNQVEYLRRTLDSVLSQTYENYEVLITDDTPSFLVKELVEQYDFKGRLHYFKNESPLGSPENWNECIKRASGEYIKILHHDDWFTREDSLEIFVNLLLNNSESSFAFSSSFVLFPNGDNWIHQITSSDLAIIKSCPAFLFLGNKIGSPSAVIYRKDMFDCFDKNLKWLVDVEFYIRGLQKFNKISYCSDALVTTFGAEGRVSDFCENDSKTEIFENFYVFHEINWKLNFINLKYIVLSFKHLLRLCKKYKVSNKREIRSFGVNKLSPIFLLLLKCDFLKTIISSKKKK